MNCNLNRESPNRLVISNLNFVLNFIPICHNRLELLWLSNASLFSWLKLKLVNDDSQRHTNNWHILTLALFLLVMRIRVNIEKAKMRMFLNKRIEHSMILIWMKCSGWINKLKLMIRLMREFKIIQPIVTRHLFLQFAYNCNIVTTMTEFSDQNIGFFSV